MHPWKTFILLMCSFFRGQEIESFYPYAEVVFEIKDPSKHYHIPLLLNPFGYSTYRGS